MKKTFGGIVFLVGLILAALIAVFSAQTVPVWAVFVLALIGLVVGVVNVTAVETRLFLTAGIAFLLSFQALASVIQTLAFGWAAVGTFFGLLNIYVAPAVAVVAIRGLFQVARD